MLTFHPEYRRKSRSLDSLEHGFSLLEILIVLAIIGLTISLVSPRLITSIESTRFAQAADTAAGTLSKIRTEAVLYRKAYAIVPTEPVSVQEGYTPRTLDLPGDWVITGNPLYVTINGLCSGGTLTLKSPDGRQARYEFPPPQCKARRIPITESAS